MIYRRMELATILGAHMNQTYLWLFFRSPLLTGYNQYLLSLILTGTGLSTLSVSLYLILKNMPPPLEKEMATHHSILAWRIPRTEESGGLQRSMGTQSRNRLSDQHSQSYR